MKKLLKIFRNIFLSLLALIILLLVLVNLSSVQTYLAKRATHILSDKLNTKVTIDKVRIDLLNHVLLEGLYIEDQQQDTLAYIGKAQVRITDWFFLKSGTPVLHYVGLTNAYIHLNRPANSSDWNYGFIEDAFSSKSNKKTAQKQEFEIDLEKVLLDNVRFHLDDAWYGYDYDIDVGSFATNIDEVNFKKRSIGIANLKVAQSSIRLRDYKGGKPPSIKKTFVIDSTPFNPDQWKLNVEHINFEDCHFAFVSKTSKPYPDEFDPEYIEVKNLTSEIKYLKVLGDTLKAQLRHFSANERSGFVVKEMQSEVQVSPIASICNELYIETNNSKIGNYYAMHYDRFPDFLDYIAKVKMVAHLKDANVDARDVAYFAPQLRQLPLSMVKISGDGAGTVDRLLASNLHLSDGFSTVKGDLLISGLPDIDKTIFDFQNGDIFTTGASVLKYAPALKNNHNVNIKAIDYAIFKGGFKGLISDFATKGTLKTNLGIVSADIKMKIPAQQAATYSGTIGSQSFDAGTLFNQPMLGTTTFNAALQGASFDINGIHIKAKSTFKDISFNGYSYKDIVADGVFDKNKFDGKLLINDSNIALGFYGNIDLSQKDITINATANLLQSNLKALKFTDVPTTLAADFDLNCSGKTIDDFIGAAKLYNINLTRKSKKLDLDSINMKSYWDAEDKHIDIESNLLSAQINGRFLLNEISNSMRYFLSRYLPNYIKSKGNIAADQDINFSIKTHKVNDLITAFSNDISGFDSSNVSGNLNTIHQTLTIDATVPYGKIGTMKLYNTLVSSKGDYNKLKLNSTVQHLVIGENILNTSLKLEALVGNDSLAYTIATKSDEQYGTATLSGNAYASKDTLYARFSPSELFLNNVKWEIPNGNKIIFANNYLSVENLELESGLQKLTVNIDKSKTNLPLIIRSYNIDIAQLASLTPAAGYQLEGRINGVLEIANIFNNQKVSSHIEANGVKILGDTVGMVRIKGYYDATEQLIHIENSSGIFNNKFSLTTQGNISLNPTNEDPINASIKIDNLPTKFIEPFLKGYASKLGGTIEGTIDLSGTFDRPNFDGGLLLRNIFARIDYIGTLYSIPMGKIKIKGQTATLDNIELLDVYKNTATASGFVRFDKINNPLMNIQLKTNQFEVVNLRDYENELFYGHVVAKTDFNVNGRISNMDMGIVASPTQKSHLYLPYNSAGDISTSTYITFKSYGKTVEQKVVLPKDKLSVKISAVLNPLIDVTLVLDPASGDKIEANGNGNLMINVPANEDYSLFGTYNIDKGIYLFKFRQIVTKEFHINSGSSISFGGNISNTQLNVNATYATNNRLYDLLDANEANQIKGTKDEDDAKIAQPVNVVLDITGTLANRDLKYQIELVEKHSLSTPAYAKLSRINQSDKTNLTNQISSLLLLGSFIPSQGITSSLATTGVKNTLGETIAAQASPLLTSTLNRLIGDSKLTVNLQYKSLSQDISDGSTGYTSDSRNVVKIVLDRNYFNDRLKIQVGSAYDWGRPSVNNQSASNFNLAGDFRAQYLLTPDGGVSFVGFRASNYDLFYGYNISRTGVGISVRKSFDNLYEFFHSQKRIQRDLLEKSKGAKQ